MRVLQINSHFSIGGPPKIVNGIYDCLISRGDECIIAASRGDMIYPSSSYKISSSFSVRINYLQAKIFDNVGLQSYFSTKKLIHFIDKYKPDIIHLHNLHGYYINYEVLFKYIKKAHIPVVWTFHDCWSMTGHCTHFDYINCNKWKGEGCSKCPQKKEYPSSLLFDNSKSNYQKKRNSFLGVDNLTIVVMSKWLASVVSQSFLKNYSTHVIPNGIDLSCFFPRKTCPSVLEPLIHQKKKIILGVAQNWGRKKGLYDFLDLSKIIPKEYVIVLIGIKSDLKNDFPSNIITIDSTNNPSELASFYSFADIFINFSVEETMGMTTVESLACGTPVIVYDRTAVPEVIDEKCGWKVGVGDYKTVLDILKTIKPKKEYIHHCVKRAHDYEKNKQYNKYVDLYKKIIGGEKD